MADLNEDEKMRLVQEAVKILAPLAQKHELDTESGRSALFEAFQLGIQFSIRETKALEEDLKDGQF